MENKNFLEIDEIENELATPATSLTGTIFVTVIVGLVIFACFIVPDIPVLIKIGIGCACIVKLIFTWWSLFLDWKNRKEEVKKENKIVLINLVLYIGGIICLIIIVETIRKLMIQHLLPSNWLMTVHPQRSVKLLLYALLVLLGVIIDIFLISKLRKRDNVLKLFLKQFYNKKVLSLIFSVWVLVLVSLSTYFATITSDSIYIHSLLNITGKKYKLSEISNIQVFFNDTGFGKTKGDFNYIITIDQQKFNLVYALVAEQFQNEETYTQLEKLDQKLVNLKINKESSKDNSLFCTLDKIYVDRFIRIVENK